MKKIVVAVIIIAVLAGVVGFGYLLSNNIGGVFSKGPTYAVKTFKTSRGDISSTVAVSGMIEEVKVFYVYIDNPTKVNKLLVEKYQTVSKGQKLLELDIETMQGELDKLRINKKIQELSMDTAAMDAEIKRAESAVRSAEKAFKDCQDNYGNSKELFEVQAISKKELEMAESALIDANMALENARISLGAIVKSQDVDANIKKENLRAIEMGIEELEKKIESCEESMICPVDGIIIELNAQEGSYTNSAQPMFRIADLDKLQVRANISEYNIKNIDAGQKVILTGDAIEEDVEILGMVESISPIAKKNVTAGGEEVSVEVVITINNQDAQLKPGLTVDCDIMVSEKNDVLIVPIGVLKTDKDGNKYALMVDDKNDVLIRKDVKLGIPSDMMVEVLEGLSEGDVIVDDPQSFHKEGTRVRVTE
ncbi:MAG: efflux RND transporter periplasmic adaptor subunit [Clostridium sp.]|nr:efflux RND transporter periplasmic adaptor subunit [Clostridium sp.]